MSTARDLISAAMRKIGAIASGETASGAELTDGLSALNAMLSSWSTEQLIIFAKVRETFSTVASQAAYTMGSGGNFATTRPQKIEDASILQNGTEFPVRILENLEEWSRVKQKALESSLPQAIYTEMTYPLATVNVWPVPNAVMTLVLYSWKPLSSIANASDDMSLPPGYEHAIIYNLALEMAPEYGKGASAEVIGLVNQRAMDSKANIKRMNWRPVLLDNETADLAEIGQTRGYNRDTGEP